MKNTERLIYFLKKCGVMFTDILEFSDNRITLIGQPFAEFEWSDNDIPVFKFCGKLAGDYEKMQNYWRLSTLREVEDFKNLTSELEKVR